MTNTLVATTRFSTMPSPLGELLLTADADGVTGLYMDAPQRGPAVDETWHRDDEALAEMRRQLEEYFAGERQCFDLPLHPRGTEFQRRVWQSLRDIPFAATTSYAAIARAVGSPKGVRAVGLANGRNPIPILVPCHRVIGSDGSLTGYGGGIERKRWLLAHEARFGDLLREG